MTPLIAQCVMCFRTAAAQQAERARVLNTGIVILLIPPILVIAGILALAWYKNAESYRLTRYAARLIRRPPRCGAPSE